MFLISSAPLLVSVRNLNKHLENYINGLRPCNSHFTSFAFERVADDFFFAQEFPTSVRIFANIQLPFFITLPTMPVHVSLGVKDNRSFDIAFLGHLETMICVDSSAFQWCDWFTKFYQRVSKWDRDWVIFSIGQFFALHFTKTCLDLIGLDNGEGSLSTVIVPYLPRRGYLMNWWYGERTAALLCILGLSRSTLCDVSMLITKKSSKSSSSPNRDLMAILPNGLCSLWLNTWWWCLYV